ncbi:hypothetical protein [Plantactinospora sp. CA-290183]|uniref:hypothetical protein n=1 Tax=Plantactinospora sp. CA-290183 TaxID=3240006 RepID=UPI003D8A3A09
MAHEQLPKHQRTLASGVPSAPPGTIFVLAVTGGVTVRPQDGRTVRFGRNLPDVDVCVGVDDIRVSRQQGVLRHRQGFWWISNTGRSPIRLPSSRWLFSNDEPIPLQPGYTPVFVRGSRHREHLLEVYVAGPDGGRPALRPGDVTEPPRTWRLSPDERLALVVLGQRYLLHEAHPQPLSRQQVAEQLAELRPAANWTVKRVEHLVADVRSRLSAGGVHGLVREEVNEPVGNALNDNLLRELVLSTTLVPRDLDLLDEPPEPLDEPPGR